MYYITYRYKAILHYFTLIVKPVGTRVIAKEIETKLKSTFESIRYSIQNRNTITQSNYEKWQGMGFEVVNFSRYRDETEETIHRLLNIIIFLYL